MNSSNKFCHFTSTENARNIISGESFFLSKYENMNDLAEAFLHKADKDRVFALSFSNSEALNIPAFYLYGGIDGKGCRIEFTGTKLRQILNNCNLYFVNGRNRKLKKAIDPSLYNIYYDWIYYIASNGYCEHRSERIESYNDLQDAIDKLKTNNKHFFIKSPIWKYENEFRIVIVFNEAVSYDRIAMCFDVKEKERGISLSFGPETTEEEFKQLSAEFSEYGVYKFKKTSDFAISMKLVDRNRELLKRN